MCIAERYFIGPLCSKSPSPLACGRLLSAELPSVDCCNLIYNQPQPCSCESTVRRYFRTAVYLFNKIKYEKAFSVNLPCQSKVALCHNGGGVS